MTKRRALIVQPSLDPPGGGQAVAAWMLQALKDDYELTLVCWHASDLAAVNRAYGTSLAPGDFTEHRVAAALRLPVDGMPFRAALLKWALLMRLARRIAQPDQLLISAENEADFGRAGIQYVHYPRQLRPRPQVDLRWYHLDILLDAYYALCERLLPPHESILQNLTLANSTWTAERVHALEPRVPVTVVPPPVAGGFPDVPWERRANGFVCIGRFSVEKELEKVIAIVERVRRRVPGVRLHLVGGRGSRGYYRRVMRLAGRHASWVEVHEDLSRAALVTLVASQRYGIHGMREEHFGIAPAEMVRGGCIVFVPDGGGQVDIVGHDPALTYASADDAVAKIEAVLNDARQQERLRTRLAALKETFSAERFVETIRRLVAEFDARTRSAR